MKDFLRGQPFYVRKGTPWSSGSLNPKNKQRCPKMRKGRTIFVLSSARFRWRTQNLTSLYRVFYWRHDGGIKRCCEEDVIPLPCMWVRFKYRHENVRDSGDRPPKPNCINHPSFAF